MEHPPPVLFLRFPSSPLLDGVELPWLKLKLNILYAKEASERVRASVGGGGWASGAEAMNSN